MGRSKPKLKTKRWAETSYRIEDAWADRLILSVPALTSWRLPRVSVELNGQRQDLRAKRLSRTRLVLEPVKFAFDREHVEKFRVFQEHGGLRTESQEDGDRSRLLFEHGPKAVHQNVQRRGALKEGRGIQLVCALQTYLWASSPAGAERLGSELEVLKARSVGLCSAMYRLMQQTGRVAPELLSLLEERARSLADGLDVSTPAARWYPSVKLAAGQLWLAHGDVERGLPHFIDISDRQEAILAAEPICAFNVQLANCLTSVILDERKDERFGTYVTRWRHVFQNYPPRMDIRFGTMEEFEKIYEASMLNYKLQLARENERDNRFRKTSLEEILEVCMRVRLSVGATTRLVARIRGVDEREVRRRTRSHSFWSGLRRFLKRR